MLKSQGGLVGGPKRMVLVSVVVGACMACSSGSSTERPGSGGTSASNGGATASGGSSSSGGTTAGSGGATSKGGSTGSGGVSTTGGAGGAGANGSTGGVIASGGSTSGTGGAASGGARGGASGGEPASGGRTSSGGTTGASLGGTSGTAGTTGKGGTTGSGGTTSSGTGPSSPSGYPMPPGASNVPQPSGSPGNITVLNWAGFKGAVSYTFDDDNSSQISAYSSLQGLGVPLTFYLWTGRTEATNSVWTQAVKDGHEIGNHTKSHSSTPPGGVDDVTAATTFIKQNLKVTATTMAAPNGAGVYTSLAPTAAMMINRGVANAVIKPNDNTDRYTLPCYIPPTGGTAAADFNPQVDAAESAGGWRVILVHGFTGGTDSAYQPVPLQEFLNGVNHTKSLGDMWIGRVEDVGSYWLGQKAVTSATKTTSGNSTTWTWTLPSNFAPGKYVRITVPGGTVSQKGTTIPWDPHGFYEIALDAGQVTVGG